MILGVFSIYDKQVQAFMQPFFCRTTGEAIRSFTDAVNDPKSQFNRYATDFSLMSHGDWDDKTGLFLGHDPVRVVGAHEVIDGDVSKPRLAM